MATRIKLDAVLSDAKETLNNGEASNDEGVRIRWSAQPGNVCARDRAGRIRVGFGQRPTRCSIRVTSGAVDRALVIANALFNLRSAMEFRVAIDNQKGRTYLAGRGAWQLFVLVERTVRSPHVLTESEERARKRYYVAPPFDLRAEPPDIPQYDWTPTGQLTISVGRYPLLRKWNDTAKTRLEKRLNSIAAEVVRMAEETRSREEAERERQRQEREAEARYETAMVRRADEMSRFQSLVRDASRHRRAEVLRSYINAFEANAITRHELDADAMDWIAWARAKADWVDPLIDFSDPLLDWPEPQRIGVL